MLYRWRRLHRCSRRRRRRCLAHNNRMTLLVAEVLQRNQRESLEWLLLVLSLLWHLNLQPPIREVLNHAAPGDKVACALVRRLDSRREHLAAGRAVGEAQRRRA